MIVILFSFWSTKKEKWKSTKRNLELTHFIQTNFNVRWSLPNSPTHSRAFWTSSLLVNTIKAKCFNVLLSSVSFAKKTSRTQPNWLKKSRRRCYSVSFGRLVSWSVVSSTIQWTIDFVNWREKKYQPCFLLLFLRSV